MLFSNQSNNGTLTSLEITYIVIQIVFPNVRLKILRRIYHAQDEYIFMIITIIARKLPMGLPLGPTFSNSCITYLTKMFYVRYTFIHSSR